MATASERQPGDEGIRVDGRCWSVDFLENALTFGRLDAIIRSTIDAAELQPGDFMVDVGCGSGRLLIEAAGMHGNCSFHGIDATPGMIDRAREAAAQHGTDITFSVGLVQELPFEDASVDVVVSTFLIHHLPDETAAAAFAELDRVLKPGGRLVIADYGRPRSLRGFVASFPMRANFYEFVRPQLKGRLDDLFNRAFRGATCEQLFLGYLPVMRAIKA